MSRNSQISKQKYWFVAAMFEAEAEVFSLTLRAKKEPLVPIVTVPGAYF